MNLSNGDIMGVDCINLLKWINTFDYDQYPKNIFTNKDMTSNEIMDCYNQSYSYYCNNIFFFDLFYKRIY